MYQEPYINYLNDNEGMQNVYPYPGGTLLGGNPNLSRPRPIYNVNPRHNLPSYSLDMNPRPYDNYNNKNINYDNSYKKYHKVIRDILESRENNLNDIVIIIL